MKFLRIALGLSVTLAGMGLGMAGCGPEEKYCAKENMTCAQVKILLDQKAREEAAAAAAAADAGDPNGKEASIMGNP